MKLKVNYDTGPVVVDIPDADIALLAMRKEREADAQALVVAEKAREKRKLLSVEVAP